MFWRVESSIPTLQPETIFMIGSFPVTNSLLMINLITLLLIVGVVLLNRTMKLRPGKAQAAVELFYEGIASLVNQITNNQKVTNRILYMIGALFVFVGIANLIGFVPGLTSITYNGEALFRSATSDFNTTFGLALVMLLLVQAQAIADAGVFGYIGKFIQVKAVVNGFRQGIGAGALGLVEFFIGLLDIISEIAKVISLSMRLFGNIYAGEILMVIILGGFAYGLPALWMAMSMFVGVIQALVFGALIAAYYGSVVTADS